MDNAKVQLATTNLKIFFEKKKLKVSEAKECMFRLIDYIDVNYDEDKRDIPFKNGNGLLEVHAKNYKSKTHTNGINKTINN